MRLKLYHFLVNRHGGIGARYHQMHDKGGFFRKLASYFYLCWLNLCYYCFFCRFLGNPKQAVIYEEKKLRTEEPESGTGELVKNGFSIEAFVERLSTYDIISFDIFDTLILRPFAAPTDLFYFLAEAVGILDFKRIRTEQEKAARQETYRQNGHYETTFQDIWERIERTVGVSSAQGMALEQQLEMQFCYANPFMLEVFCRLQDMGKTIIVVSDMYFSEEFLTELLRKNGYIGISRLYVSCEYGMSKNNGQLFKQVKKDWWKDARIIHVGDNETSDVKMAKNNGLDSLYYPNVNKKAADFRPYDMSPMIGGAYRGIVDNHLYTGLCTYSMEYEYGFIYGGLFVLGYCNFIHEYVQNHAVDKVLFFSRDGDILKQVYDFLYPQENTAYVYWSRQAATKLMADRNRSDYFRRFIDHKINQKIPIEEILVSMGLKALAEVLEQQQTGPLKEKELTEQNAPTLQRFLEEQWAFVQKIYVEEQNAAAKYYAQILEGAERAVAVDIGWAGSGAMSLSYLAEKVWKIPCEIMGIIAGTNTIHNAEPDASESFLQSGKLNAYLFSQSHNRDLMKKHDLNKDYNVFWELLLASPTPQFQGFGWKRDLSGTQTEEVEFHFGKCDANQEGIKEIQRGVLDFAKEYTAHFQKFPYMFRINGRDAYAPMLIASSHHERYLKAIEKRFQLEINVS